MSALSPELDEHCRLLVLCQCTALSSYTCSVLPTKNHLTVKPPLLDVVLEIRKITHHFVVGLV